MPIPIVVQEWQLLAVDLASYRMAGNFHGVLIFVIFVVDLAVTKFHEN